MEESFKNRIILILSISTAIFFIATVSSCANVKALKRVKDNEIDARFTAEAEKEKILKEKSAIEEGLKSTQQLLGQEKAAHEENKKALAQEQLINQSLKEEVDKISKLKEALEEDLKEALVKGKPLTAPK
jgi:hypothetical protein